MARSSRREIRPPDRYGEVAAEDELVGITSSSDDDADADGNGRRRGVVVADDESDGSSSDDEDDERAVSEEAPTSERPDSESECDGTK